jgi:hypothetical protein
MSREPSSSRSSATVPSSTALGGVAPALFARATRLTGGERLADAITTKARDSG